MEESEDMVDQYKRASIAWEILVKVATKREMITYKQLAELVQVHHRAVKFFLDIIQDYCIRVSLPPLTILVVNQKGIQGKGFIACHRDIINLEKECVFDFNWDSIKNPYKFIKNDGEFNILIDKVLNNPDDSIKVYEVFNDRGVAQQMFRQILLKAYDNKCAICGNSVKELLEACHIIPWTKCNLSQRIDPRNGLLLCRNHHKLYDVKLIKINSEGKIEFNNSYLSKLNNDYMKNELKLNGKQIRFPKNIKCKPNFTKNQIN